MKKFYSATRAFAATLGALVPVTCFAYVSGAGAIEGNERNTIVGDGAQGAFEECASDSVSSLPLCSTAVGRGAAAIGQASAAVGDSALVTGPYGVAFGAGAHAYDYAVSMGGTAKAGPHATAISYGARASAPYSIAIGELSGTDNERAIALGYESRAFATDGTAIGSGALVMTGADDAVALGALSLADRPLTVSVGDGKLRRQIVNVAPGTRGSDVATIEQLEPAIAALGGSASFDSVTGAVTGPVYRVQGGTQTDVGSALAALDQGLQYAQEDIRTLFLTQDASTESGIAVTYDVRKDGSIDFGSVTLGGIGNPAAVLSNIADGTRRTDAVNFGQLTDLRSELLTTIGELDSRVTLIGADHGNSPIAPASSLLDGTSNTAGQPIAGAFAGGGVGSLAAGDSALATAQHATAIGASTRVSADDGTALGANANVTANTAVALGAGSIADRSNTVSVGASGGERQIVNVAAGTTATDAVNVSQLQAASEQSVSQARSYTDMQFHTLTRATDARFAATERAIQAVAKIAYAGIAGAMAMPNLTPSAPGRVIVAAGTATYHGAHAFAAGMTYRTPDARWLVNTAMSFTSTGDTGFRAQVGYEF
jgi:autotransporter adhesin